MNRLRAGLCSALLMLTASIGLVPSAEAGTSPVNGRYLSSAYLAISRVGAAVYVNALVHQDSAGGTIGSPNRTVYLQRQLSGQWQNVLARQTNAHGQFTVGFPSAPSYHYRLVAIAGSTTWAATSATATSPVLGGVLQPGHSLISPNDAVLSPSGEYRLAVELGGHFHLEQNDVWQVDGIANATVLEVTGEPAAPVDDRSRLTMLGNGDLALISAAGKPLWSSRTSGAGNALYVQNDGNLVIYNKASQAVWSAGTTPVMVLTGSTIPSGKYYVYKTFTQFDPHSVGRLSMQRDGNLVLLGGGQPTWSTNTHVPGSYAAFTANGTLEVYSPAHKLLWNSVSHGKDSIMRVLCGQLMFSPTTGNTVYVPTPIVPMSCR